MFRDNSNKLLIIIIILWSPLALGATPIDGAGWYQAAVEARQAERLEDAHDALNKAEELEFSPIRLNFERARLYVASGDRAAAADVARLNNDSASARTCRAKHGLTAAAV